MRVVSALDSFKESIPAAAAVDAVAAGWRDVDAAATVAVRPMADGGEGTLDAFATLDGAVRRTVTVTGPHAGSVAASWVLLPSRTGVVELASTSGIELLGHARMPWDADTTGFGETIGAALDAGVHRLVLGIGSSASTDGGIGMLAALGARLVDVSGRPVSRGARGLEQVASVDLSGLRELPRGGVRVLTDVTNPLIGPRGAAAVFGPQKGVRPADVSRLDAALAAYAAVVGGDPAAHGAGAAGGTGFALRAWGAELVSGAGEVAALVGLPDAIAAADLVVTGEGAFDASSVQGKAAGAVAALAAAAGIPVALVAGRVDAGADVSAFTEVVSLSALAGSAAAALAQPARWLRAAGVQLARGARRLTP
ncbi:glycerate kinase [Microbacterium sp.]|uniref:glycerate kinase n=1 Tax=Microbacterium sp. TaxID=51671 RepID=UPI003A86271E